MAARAAARSAQVDLAVADVKGLGSQLDYAEKRRDDVAKLAQTGSTNQFALQDAVATADLLTAPRFCTVDVERGRRAPTLYEQVYPQQNGFALIMLWLELPEDNEDEQDDDRTSKERLRDRQARYVR